MLTAPIQLIHLLLVRLLMAAMALKAAACPLVRALVITTRFAQAIAAMPPARVEVVLGIVVTPPVRVVAAQATVVMLPAGTEAGITKWYGRT